MARVLQQKSRKVNAMSYRPEHINYALVEGTRPSMYCAMKYWGRKPHNIWNDYIDHYCPKDGIVLDPFVGSGITAFEAMKLKRKVIATDLNPLSSFVIEVVSGSFDRKKFETAVSGIVAEVEGDEVYRDHYTRDISGKSVEVYNYLWENGKVVKVRAKDSAGNSYSENSSAEDEQAVKNMERLEIPYWFPQDPFPRHPSINHNFVGKIGGRTMDKLWTRRNLYLLAKIFDLICKEADGAVKSQLMYAFIHTLHLVSKMVVPRTERGNRDFSGSWGRADYMIRKRSMEQNPLVVFKRSCFEKQGLVKALEDAKHSIPNACKLNYVQGKSGIKPKADVNYGVLDIADLPDYIADNSIDFIMTDPPYGGLVQYMDLSMVWLVWLQKFDAKYTPASSGEITYKRGITDRQTYKRRLVKAFKNLYRVLKPDHYLVVTFHNQDIREWNDFVCAIRESGFIFEKITHQYNKRSGESNVSNPYGTTGSDFYIRCKKDLTAVVGGGKEDLSLFVINKVRQILIERGEETPFEFIINGLLPDMLQAGYLEPEQPADELRKILKPEVGEGKMFSIRPNPKNKGGDIFWFNEPARYINHINISLSDRVEKTVRALLRQKVSVKYDDIVATIFKEFPNGLTPDPRGLKKIVAKHAKMSGGKWKLDDAVERECTEHTRIISLLCKIAKKAGVKSHVGNREKSEVLEGDRKLSEIATLKTLDVLKGYGEDQLSRLGMIDSVWVDSSRQIVALFEVENSTGFIEAIARASHVSASVPKFMIVPTKRLNEFLHYTDPYFVNGFKDNNWKYLVYDDVELLATSRSASLGDIEAVAKEL